MGHLIDTIETERLILRPYAAGDGAWYYQMGLRNRGHLARYETENPARSLANEAEAEALLRDFAAAWAEREFFFMGAFDRHSGDFVAQIYVGPVDWDPPCFEIGYFADVDHEGQGYVTEAVRAVLAWLFADLDAAWVRLECDATNVRSRRLAERVGMVRQAHLPGEEGQPGGTLVYGMMKDAFVRETQDKPTAGRRDWHGEKPTRPV